MKLPLKYVFSIFIITPAVFFAVYFLFARDGDGNIIKYQDFGTVIKDADTHAEPQLNVVISNAANNASAPILKYRGGIQKIGSCVVFKDMFLVTTENGEKPGSLEDDFKLYLKDIRTSADYSVLEKLYTEDIGALEEIPTSFIYDQNLEVLYIHDSGNYTVTVKVYGANGSQAEYEFILPVEIEG